MALDHATRAQIIDALIRKYQLKERSNTEFLRNGVCPSCGKKELYVSKTNLYAIKCNRYNACGFETTVKEEFPDFFENWNHRYPSRTEDPNATADAYMNGARGFDLGKIRGWDSQGLYRHPKTKGLSQTATVVFKLPNGSSMERFVETMTVWDRDKEEWITRKMHFIGPNRGIAWTPPKQEILNGDEVWITEGIIDAISLALAGKKVAASLSANNYPSEFLKSLPRSQPLVWAYDDDNAGHKAIEAFHKRALNEEFANSRAAMIPFKRGKKQDWNSAYIAGSLTNRTEEDKAAKQAERNFKTYLYHGDLLLARNAQEKANLIHGRTGKNTFHFAYKGELWWNRFDSARYATDEFKDNLKDIKEYMQLSRICNSTFSFLYFMADRDTDESWYYARITTKNGVFRTTFTGGQLASSSEFKKRLLSTINGALWKGNSAMLDHIIENDMSFVKEVKTINYIGYSKEHRAYVFPTIAVKDGQTYTVNDDEYFQLGNTAVRSLLSGTEIIIGKKENYTEEWTRYLWDAYEEKGIIACAFFLGSLFAEQIREKYKNFPFLEMVGEGGTGKSTLITFLWRLLGRDHEGFDPNKATSAGRYRQFAQISNMPVALIESDSDKDGKSAQFDWDELKMAINGKLSRTIGLKTSGLETGDMIFRGSILISQNEEVNGSTPILSRIIHTMFKHSDMNSKTKEAADLLDSLTIEQLSYFLIKATTYEKQFMKTFADHFKNYEKQVMAIDGITLPRIGALHATIMVCVKALGDLVNLPSDWVDYTQNYLMDTALKQQQKLSKDPEKVTDFWNVVDDIISRKGYQLNHAGEDATDKIWINLEEVYDAPMNNGTQLPPKNEMRKLLRKSKTRLFVGQGTVRSKTKNRPIRCYQFQIKGKATQTA